MPNRIARTEARRRSSPGLVSYLFNDFLDLVFPPCCAGCGRVDSAWCVRCEAQLAATPIQLHRRQLGKLAEVVATGLHDGKLQQAIQALKYHNVRGLRAPLGQRLITAMHRLGWSPDAVLPIPLHPNRQRQRGYNQADLLSITLAEALNIPYPAGALRRVRDTRSQVGLSARERLENMQGAFTANTDEVAGRAFLLIDDVCTTGATLAASAHALRRADAAQVFCLTVTIAKLVS